MAYCTTIENCCGVCEVGDFRYNTDKQHITNQRKEIEEALVEFCTDEAVYNQENTYYNFFIATTQRDEQIAAGVALKELGFRSREFKDRLGEKTLLFWTRRGLPKDLKARISAEFKERKKNDRW